MISRELHDFLEVSKDFSNLIKQRLEQYDFAENQDFVCLTELSSNGRGGHNKKEYHITIDIAFYVSWWYSEYSLGLWNRSGYL